MDDTLAALAAATDRAKAEMEQRTEPPLPPSQGWWTPFWTRGRSGQIARQLATGGGTCPTPMPEKCDCGYPRKETTP